MKKIYYANLDIFKFIMAILVVAIHTHPLDNYDMGVFNVLLETIEKHAVPFFFLTTGYLLAEQLEWPYHSECIDKIKKYIIKTVKLYFVWTVIYMPLTILHYIKSDLSYIKIVLDFIRGFFFVGEHYNSWMLWYLLSTIYALLFIVALLKLKMHLRVILVISIIIYVFGSMVTALINFPGILPTVVEWFVNIMKVVFGSGRLFTGIGYIACGMYLRKNCISRKTSVLLFVLSFSVKMFLNHFLGDLVLFISAISLFSIVLNIKVSDKQCYKEMRETSKIIYFTHLYVWTIYYSIMYHEKTYGLDSFLVTVMITFIIAIGFSKLRLKVKRCDSK